jgi:small-conductance mechanosensitive channel
MKDILESISSFALPGLVLALIIGLLILNTFVFQKLQSVRTSSNVVKRSLAFLIILLGSIVFILALPIDKNLKGQILSFFGIIISAGIALSSTTVLGNLIAGLMNSSMKRFKNGDLISLGEFMGRVTKKSAFHTEIQLEDSNFLTIPNLYIASNPLKLTRKSNTVISTSISLGYDVPRNKIEESLKQAALDSGLTDPYVYITKLGDFSVVYKIHGFLEDSTKFFSSNSLLNGSVMDALHKNGIEIVSPAFMNQRRVDDAVFIPSGRIIKTGNEEEKSPEELIFDKAIESEEIEKKKEYLKQYKDRIEELKKSLKEIKDKNEVKLLKARIERMEKSGERLEEDIRKSNNKV